MRRVCSSLGERRTRLRLAKAMEEKWEEVDGPHSTLCGPCTPSSWQGPLPWSPLGGMYCIPLHQMVVRTHGNAATSRQCSVRGERRPLQEQLT